MNQVKSRYWRRVLIFMLIIGIIPVFVLGVFSYKNSSMAIQKKVNESNQQLLLLMQMRVEQTLEVVYNYYALLGDTTFISECLDSNLNYTDFETIVKIQGNLVDLQKLQSIVKSAYLINIDKDWIVSNYDFSKFSSKKNKEYIKSLVEHTGNIFWMFNDDSINNKEVSDYSPLSRMSLVIKIPYNKPNKLGVIIVNLSEKELEKYFKFDKQNENTIVIDENGLIFYDKEKDNIGKNLAQIPYLKDILTKGISQGFFTAKINGEKSGIVFRKSNYNNWMYVSIYSINDVTKESRSIGIITIILSMIIVIVISVFAVFGARLIYKPINYICQSVRNVSQNNEKWPIDEIMYIDRGINSLVSKKVQLEKKLEKQISQIEELFMLKLLRGEMTEEEIEQKIKSIGNLKPWKFANIITIQIDSIENAEDRTKDMDILLLLVNNSITETLKDCFIIQPVVSRKVIVALVGAKYEKIEKSKEYVFIISEKIHQIVNQRLDILVNVGISRQFNKLIEAQIAYKESLEALFCKNNFEKQSILFYEDVQPGKFIRISYPKNLEEELVEAINNGTIEKSFTILDNIIENIYSEHTGYNEHKYYINRLLMSIIKILQDSGASLNTIFDESGSIIEELNSITNVAEIKNCFKNKIIKPIIPILQEQRNNRNKLVLDEIIKMIEEEYDTDLSLEECASRFNYHPSYIWKIMRSELNISFSEYLSEHRLKIAKKWLKETGMNVGEIAEKLRYTNSQNFIRYFKKHEGITPGQYRQKDNK